MGEDHLVSTDPEAPVLTRWHSNKEASQNPTVLNELSHLPGLLKLAWKPVATSPI